MASFTDREDLTLADITIPVSHDAGLCPEHYAPYSGNSIGKHQTICQYVDIAGQLAVGSRGFDIRIAKDGNILRTFHGEGGIAETLGGWGQRVDRLFEQVDQFLRDHPGELVIARISHTAEEDGAHRAIWMNVAPERLFKCNGRNIAKIPLNRLRGKCIAIFDKDALAEAQPQRGLHRFSKYPATTDEGGLTICGLYAGWTADLKHMCMKAISCGNDHGTHKRSHGRHDHLYMIYWQIAAMLPSSSVKTFTTKGQEERKPYLNKLVESKGSHYNLDYILNLHRGMGVHSVGGKRTKVTRETRKKFRPNIINLDFVNDISIGKVIEFNADLLE